MSLFKRYTLRWSTPTLFTAALMLAYAYLTLRNTGQYPSVFGDEWTYSSAARLTPFADTQIPNYLYYTVYRLTSSCGDGFLECARLLNAWFMVAAAPFIYLIARQYMTAPVAAAVALLAVLSPGNTYTAYFMPESMYYCGFWLFSWTVLRRRGHVDARSVALSAVLLGLLAMVKVHALFLLPPYAVYLVYRAYAQRAATGGAWLGRAALLVALALACAAAARYGVGYLYAGGNGLYLLGTLYTNQAQTRPGPAVLLELAVVNLRGHLMALTLLCGLPLAAAALQCLSPRARAQTAPGSTALLVYSALMIPALVAVTALFTAMVAGSGAESGARLHMRYYDFSLPLLLVLAGAQLGRAGDESRARRLLVAAPLVLLMVLASQYLLPAYTPNHIDSPALFGLVHDKPLRHALEILGLLCVLVWIVHARLGTRLFLFLFMPAALLVGAVFVNIYARISQRPDDYVKAGLYTHQYLNQKEASRLTIVGADIANLFKTRFFVDNTDVRLLRLPLGSKVTTASLDYPNGWVLAIGDYDLPPGSTLHSGNRGYTLLRVVPPEQANIYTFSEAERDDMRSTGLSGIEDWGRWSEGPRAVLEFTRPLPRRLLLRLDVAAYGPNAEHDFQVTIDGRTVPLRAPAEHGVVELRFTTGGQARRISIDIPRPTSPQDLGYGGDQRKLGIGLYRMEVIDEAAPRQAR